MNKIYIILVVILMGIAEFGCATVTKVNSDPRGAKLYVNGEYVGETPAIYHSERDLGRRYRFQLIKEGYEPLDFYVDSEMSWIVGYLMWNPYTMLAYQWAWGLNDGMKIHMKPVSKNRDADTSSSSPEKF